MALFYALYKIKREKKKEKHVWVGEESLPGALFYHNNNNTTTTTITITTTTKIIISSTHCTRALNTCAKNITTDTHRRIFQTYEQLLFQSIYKAGKRLGNFYTYKTFLNRWVLKGVF